MQAVGFIMSFILFIIAAAAFPVLNKKGPGSHAFEFIYFFSSFWLQFGPNSTTFLIAGEVYPAPVRATAHGASAAVGKLGALAATVLYNYIGARTKFWVRNHQEGIEEVRLLSRDHRSSAGSVSSASC